MPLRLLDRFTEDPAKQQSPTRQRWYTALIEQVNILLTGVQTGLGSPEGVVTAPQGSLFRRIDGAAGSTLYVKNSGGVDAPTATGWAAVS